MSDLQSIRTNLLRIQVDAGHMKTCDPETVIDVCDIGLRLVDMVERDVALIQEITGLERRDGK